MESLRTTDDQSKAVQKTPNRVSLDSMLDKIAGEYFTTLADAFSGNREEPAVPLLPGMETMTVCVLVMRNGFIVIGKSAPADPANYDEALGRKFAREDAIRQLWPLEGYALREKIGSANPA